MTKKIIFSLQKLGNVICKKVENSNSKNEIEAWLSIGLYYNSFLINKFNIYLD